MLLGGEVGEAGPQVPVPDVLEFLLDLLFCVISPLDDLPKFNELLFCDLSIVVYVYLVEEFPGR